MDQENFTPQNGGGQPAGGQPGRGLAIAALVLGILSVLNSWWGGGIVVCIVGLILAVIARNKGFSGGIGTGGLVLSIIGVVVNGLVLIICGSAICASLGTMNF